MKQLIRIVSGAVLVLAMAVLGVGGTTVALSYNSELESTAAVLDQGVEKIELSGGTLTSAIMFADESLKPISVALVAFDKSVSGLRETEITFASSYSTGLLKAATKHAVVIEGEVPFQLRAFHTTNDEYVLIATPISDARHQLTSNVLLLVIASILAVVLGGVLVYLLGRRNMKNVIETLTNTAAQEKATRRSMQDFMGDASHELRTPLTVIKGYAELLAKNSDADVAARDKAFKRIVEQVDRMDETISGLLELAEVGSISANTFEPIELDALVLDAAEDLRAISPTREITVSIEPAIVRGSAALLNRLLNNATGNIARHAGQKAPVAISLTVAKRQAILVIEDGGKGLPEAAYTKGIQAFQRFDDSRSRETGGTGLGMSIMNSIVQAHEGSLAISKSKLGGLRLEIKLPLN